MSSRSTSESAYPSAPGSGTVSIGSADSNSLYAGVARSAVRALALYFSRPVRLFRPSKASGWTTLRYAAQRDGASFSPQYIAQYVRQHGFSVLPRHFVPPLLINTALGTLLFTSYTSISLGLNTHTPNMSTTMVAAVSGAGAGAIQAIAGTPAENVRILMEQGVFHSHTSVSGWRHAWKEVFLDTRNSSTPKGTTPVRMRLSDAREAQIFARELREMAGRGWNGWGWGFSKDIFGYGLFFAIFDLSRRAAIHTSHAVELMVSGKPWTIRSIKDDFDDFERVNGNGGSRAPTTARIAQGAVLVNGGVVAGVAYEYVGRPFDAVRREWHVYTVSRATSLPVTSSTPTASPSSQVHDNSLLRRRVVPPLPMLVKDIYASGGLRAFFQSPVSISSAPTTGWQSRIYPVLRTLGRVGPWGVGFLVWEAFGPGIQ